MNHLSLLAIAMLAAGMTFQSAAPVRTVPSVDINRYLGEWHEAARLPNRFQRDCAGEVRATYSRRSDGRIDVVNRCREQDGSMKDAQGVARIVDTATNAKLEVRFAPAFLSFLPMVWGDYWIIGLAPDYSWAVVGSPDRKYLWILSRSPAMDPAQLEKALTIAREQGYDTSTLIRAR